MSVFVAAGAAGLCALGWVCYRAGYKTAENKAFAAREKENEQVDKVLRAHAALERGELLERLRARADK